MLSIRRMWQRRAWAPSGMVTIKAKSCAQKRTLLITMEITSWTEQKDIRSYCNGVVQCCVRCMTKWWQKATATLATTGHQQSISQWCSACRRRKRCNIVLCMKYFVQITFSNYISKAVFFVSLFHRYCWPLPPHHPLRTHTHTHTLSSEKWCRDGKYVLYTY